jgi:hypothetical protein
MSRQKRNLWTGGIALGCAALALLIAPALLRGYDSGQASASGKLVMHEWGTFTSFAGSDGVNLEFRPLVTNDLPRFILTPYKQSGNNVFDFSKDSFVAQQRMETPVTYFYTETPREVNVRVDFPKGMLTEWYPAVMRFESGLPNAQGTVQGKAFLDWGKVRLTPQEQFAKVRVRNPNARPAPAPIMDWGKVGLTPQDQGANRGVLNTEGLSMPASLPPVGKNNHYAHARETDSAIVETVDANRGSHFEKFLFYRGLGNFELPMKLVARGGDRFAITNNADDASVRFTRLDPISSHGTIEASLPTAESSVDQLAEATARELIATGLYEKEALAMVNTWRSSWFGENGTRLLYLVPGNLTEELLPLTIKPVPDENVRVLVGRLETLTPEDCQRLEVALTGSNADEAPTDEEIEAELNLLGRFAEPAIQFVISQTSDAMTREKLETIVAKLRHGK